MRREWVSIVFVVLLGASATVLAMSGWPAAETREHVAAPVAVQTVPPAGMRDETAMVLVGTAMIGLAAAVRRAA